MSLDIDWGFLVECDAGLIATEPANLGSMTQNRCARISKNSFEASSGAEIEVR